ncbi:hypothetical protein TERTU_3757 [Teredinibacter turnerae T7901]|uniref:Uncharacterized protein n=1 Tax=Teredinibacter turnerae (strain ATCC 39867 / T7901) TaxID=377629 RepID=C5BSD7_TERTT|nr:hypothetical protein TERTU_3757 [Teredinibacter turnerae T7901]
MIGNRADYRLNAALSYFFLGNNSAPLFARPSLHGFVNTNTTVLLVDS